MLNLYFLDFQGWGKRGWIKGRQGCLLKQNKKIFKENIVDVWLECVLQKNYKKEVCYSRDGPENVFVVVKSSVRSAVVRHA